MKRPIRIFLVPVWSVLVFAFCYLVVIAFNICISHINYLDINRDINLRLNCHIMLIIGGCAYGIARFARFHPLANKSYARWLMTTPCNYPQPLPLGPILLAWQDVLALSVFFLLDRFQLHYPGPAPVIAFFLFYLSPLTLAQLSAKPHGVLVIPFILFPLTGLIIDHTWWLLILAFSIYLIVAYSACHSLKHFPWKMGESQNKPGFSLWLFSRIGPIDEKDFRLRPSVGLCMCAFFAWWVFCGATIFKDLPSPRDTVQALQPAIWVIGSFLALLRFIVYGSSFRPPISLLGRFATGRLIIPGYDQILIAPLVTLLITAPAPYLFLLPIPPAIIAALIAFILPLPALLIGPGMYRWQLTGFHSIAHRRAPRDLTQRSSPIKITLVR